MAKANQILLEKNMRTIGRGAQCFGIAGWLLIACGAVQLVLHLAPSVAGGPENAHMVTAVLATIVGRIPAIYGILLLLGQDTLQAIVALIKEMQEIA